MKWLGGALYVVFSSTSHTYGVKEMVACFEFAWREEENFERYRVSELEAFGPNFTGSCQYGELTHIFLADLKDNLCKRGDPKIVVRILDVLNTLMFYGEEHHPQAHNKRGSFKHRPHEISFLLLFSIERVCLRVDARLFLLLGHRPHPVRRQCSAPGLLE